MKNIILSGKGIVKTFGGKQKRNTVLNGIDIEIYEGDFTVIMGSSGAGKSTLLYVLSGMDRVTSGTVAYRGEQFSDYGEKKMSRLRIGEFGFVFQNTHLVSNLTLLENVTVAGYLDNRKTTTQTQEKSRELLEKMNVTADVADRLPSSVSGGEAQRAAVARAVINSPGILFADEPTGALNKRNTEEVLNLFGTLNESGQSILMVTHDLRSALRGNRVIYLDDGKIVGEKVLPPYQKENAKERENNLSEWLSSMSW